MIGYAACMTVCTTLTAIACGVVGSALGTVGFLVAAFAYMLVMVEATRP